MGDCGSENVYCGGKKRLLSAKICGLMDKKRVIVAEVSLLFDLTARSLIHW
jgi:hypothetical protein